MDHPRALIVDDEPSVRDVCRRALLRLGLEVDCAAEPEEAGRLLREGRYTVALTDIHIKGETDGVGLALDIRRMWPETDVIVMTGYPEVDTAVAALKGGACEYLLKPVGMGKLQDAVMRCLERRVQNPELARETLLREEVEAAYTELRLNEGLGDAILARANHELRTPLSIARMSCELISQLPLPAPAASLLVRLQESLDRLHVLVEDILLLRELRLGDLRLAPREVDLRELAAAACRELKPRSEEAGLSLDLLSSGEPRPVLGDPSLLGKALRNLVLNAIRFNKPGGKVEVAVRFGPVGASLAVSDTGIGIPQDRREAVFLPFYQVADHLTRTVGGLGIGLATARRILEAHGGGVSAAAHPGGGSVFTAFVPYAQDEGGGKP